MSARIGIFFFEIGIKKVLKLSYFRLFRAVETLILHKSACEIIYNHRVVRPMKERFRVSLWTYWCTSCYKTVMLFSGSRTGKYKCQGVDLSITIDSLQWGHNEHSSISNHWRLHCLLNCCFRRRSKKTSKLSVTGLCVGNPPVTGEFPA